MSKKSNLSKYQILENKVLEKVNPLIAKDNGLQDIKNSFKDGDNAYLKMVRLESSSYDMTWVKRIEDCLYELGQIVLDPKKNTKTIGDVVAVELAKKTNAESVRYLASHSEHVKEIDDHGDVIPKKVLNIGAEDDFGIYENRFIATLIRQLVLFVEKRYDYASRFAPLMDVELYKVKSTAIIDGSQVEIENTVRISKPSLHHDQKLSSNYLERIKQVRTYLRYYYNSEFMKTMKNEKDVRAPILQTNIIRKNPLYHKCYKLFTFIRGYNELGLSYSVNETYYDFTAEDMDEVNNQFLLNFLAAKSENPYKEGFVKTKEYTPKVLISCDDEEFVYGPLLKGPVEFVRVDEDYMNYLSKTGEIPSKLNKAERLYYLRDIKEANDAKKDVKELQNLKNRKEKALKEWDKYAAKTADENEKMRQKIMEEIRQEDMEREAKRIQLAREALSKVARQDGELNRITNHDERK